MGMTAAFSMRVLTPLALSALAGCAQVDVPENPAQLGHWVYETKMQSVSINSMTFDRERARQFGGAGMIDDIEKNEDHACIEPYLEDLDKAVNFAANELGSCEPIDGTDTLGGRHFEFQCQKDKLKARLVADGDLAATEGNLALVVTVRQPKPTGGDDIATMRFNTKMTRVGDCS